MTKHSERDGFRVNIDSRILYGVIVALTAFVIRSETHHTASVTRLNQLERRTDTLESDLKIIKESLYEIRGDVKTLIKGANK